MIAAGTADAVLAEWFPKLTVSESFHQFLEIFISHLLLSFLTQNRWKWSPGSIVIDFLLPRWHGRPGRQASVCECTRMWGVSESAVMIFQSFVTNKDEEDEGDDSLITCCSFFFSSNS